MADPVRLKVKPALRAVEGRVRPRPPAVPEVVGLAKLLVSMAESGEIQALSYAVVKHYENSESDEQVFDYQTGFFYPSGIKSTILVAGAHIAANRLQRRIDDTQTVGLDLMEAIKPFMDPSDATD